MIEKIFSTGLAVRASDTNDVQVFLREDGVSGISDSVTTVNNFVRF